MNCIAHSYLPDGLPIPVLEPDGLSAPFWNGLRADRLLLQRCNACRRFQWGPEWICHACLSFDLGWEQADPVGEIFSWTRVWHPTHEALKAHGPYLVVVVELPACDRVRILGNLLGDPLQAVRVGARVHGVFEQHDDAQPPFALLQWTLGGEAITPHKETTE